MQYLGRGNTAGDAIAYLPKEKILIAGDLVDSPVPYLGGGFPIEQVATLKKVAELDFETIIPGHGAALKGKTFVQQRDRAQRSSDCKVLGSGQPDRSVVFALQHVHAVFGLKATADYFVTSIR